MVLNSPVLSHLLHHSRSSQILWTLHSSNPKCHLISSDFIWYFIWYFQWPKGVPGFDTKILRAPGQRVHDRSVHPNQVEGSGSLDPKKKDPGDDKMTKWSSGCVKRWFSYDMIDMVGWKWWYLLALVAIFNHIYIIIYPIISYWSSGWSSELHMIWNWRWMGGTLYRRLSQESFECKPWSGDGQTRSCRWPW